MALLPGQMPMQPARGGGLGFPRMGPAPHPAALAPAAAPAPSALPTGVMPMNPGIVPPAMGGSPVPAATPDPVLNHPVDVVTAGPAPTAQPTPAPMPAATPATPAPTTPIDPKKVQWQQHMQDKMTRRAGHNPGFLDKVQAQMTDGHGFGGMLTRQDPGFNWSSFISGLRSSAPTPSPTQPRNGLAPQNIGG